MNTTTKAAAFVALTLSITACGGSSASDAEAPAETTTTNAPATTAQPDVETTTSTVADAEEEAEVADVEGEEAAPVIAYDMRPELTMAVGNAGPVSATPVHCTITGNELISSDARATSIALAGERAFVATSEGLFAYTVDGSNGCTFTLDTTIGDGGILSAEEYSSVSGNAAGRLLASNIFGTMVFDIEPGYSYECDGLNGTVSLSDDGTQALGQFGLSAIELWTLGESNCEMVEEIALTDFEGPRWGSFDGVDMLIGAKGLDEITYATRFRDGTEVWRAGTDEIGADGWFGWIHGMARCGSFTCALDTNTNQLAIIADDGSIVTSFEVEDMIGIRGWVEPLILGTDGFNYLIAGETYDDDQDNRTYYSEIIRIEVNG